MNVEQLAEKLVNDAVTATQAQKRFKILITFIKLFRLPLDELFAEVCIQIQDATQDQDIAKLLEAVTLPTPPEPLRLILGAWKGDTDDLLEYSGKNPIKLLSSLIVLLAALKDARARLD